MILPNNKQKSQITIQYILKIIMKKIVTSCHEIFGGTKSIGLFCCCCYFALFAYKPIIANTLATPFLAGVQTCNQIFV